MENKGNAEFSPKLPNITNNKKEEVKLTKCFQLQDFLML